MYVLLRVLPSPQLPTIFQVRQKAATLAEYQRKSLDSDCVALSLQQEVQ